VFAAALAAYLAIALWLVWRTAILEPYSDMFDWVERYDRWRTEGGLWAFLWTPHNVHHLVWTFLILLADIRVFGAASGLFLAIGLAALVATAGLLAATAAAAAGTGFRLLAAGGAAALSVMGCHVLDANADINTTYLHALVFAVGAVLLAERRAGHPGRAAGALACAVAAGLGSAAGLAVWPALLVGALRERAWRWAALVAAAGLAFGALYLVGEPRTAAAAVPPGRWLAAGELFLTYLGLPWARGLQGFGWLLGAAALAASLAAVKACGRPGEPWPRRAAAGLILVSLGTAAMAAVGRGAFMPPDQPPVRYAVFLIPMQVGLWVAVLPAIARAWTTRRRWMEAGLVAASAFLLVHQAVMADYAIRTSDAIRQALADFGAGRRTPAMLTRVYPDLAKAQALSRRMRAEGLYQRELTAR
jgi:hypothetical protein